MPVPRFRSRPRFRPALEGLEDRLSPAVITWLGGDGAWDDPARWDLHRTPTVADDVFITTPGAVFHHGLDTVQSLTLDGAVLRQDQPQDALVVTAAMTWPAGTLAGPGRVTVGTAGTLALGDAVALDGATLENLGQATWTGGIVHGGQGAQFLNAGSVEVQQSALLAGGGPFLVTNVGTWAIDAGTTLALGPGATFANGTDQAAGTLTGGGTLVVLPGGGSPLVLGPSLISAVTVHNDGTTLLVGDLTLTDGARLVNAPGGTLTADFGASVLTLTGGELANFGTLQLQGTPVGGLRVEQFTWGGGTVSSLGIAALQLTVFGSLRQGGPAGETIAFVNLVNQGVWDLDGPGDFTCTRGSTITNEAGAELDLGPTVNVVSAGSPTSRFVNLGTLVKATGKETTRFTLDLDNQGTLVINTLTSTGKVASSTTTSNSQFLDRLGGGAGGLGGAGAQQLPMPPPAEEARRDRDPFVRAAPAVFGPPAGELLNLLAGVAERSRNEAPAPAPAMTAGTAADPGGSGLGPSALTFLNGDLGDAGGGLEAICLPGLAQGPEHARRRVSLEGGKSALTPLPTYQRVFTEAAAARTDPLAEPDPGPGYTVIGRDRPGPPPAPEEAPPDAPPAG